MRNDSQIILDGKIGLNTNKQKSWYSRIASRSEGVGGDYFTDDSLTKTTTKITSKTKENNK